MRNIGQLLVGLITAAGSTLLVLAAISLALLEGGGAAIALVPTSTPTAEPPVSISVTATAERIPEVTMTMPFTPTVTATEELHCQNTPENWIPYTVQGGETIESLVEQSQVAMEEFLKANCFVSASLRLEPGWVVYLPPTVPTATVTVTPTPAPPTPTLCGAPGGWVNYVVQPGDTLFRLSIALGISQYELQQANCLSGTLIYAGQILRVPFIPARPTATRTLTPTPENTNTPIPPTWTNTPVVPSETPVPPTDTPVPPTDTPIPPTDTPIPSDTPITLPTDKPSPPTDTPVPPPATASSSDLPVSFNASGTCSVAGTAVTFTSDWSCTITASQAGNANYTAAADVPRTFTITN